MPFSVVQTRQSKKSKPTLTIVPSKWTSGNEVYWPPTNFVSLSANGDSEPIKEVWQKQNCKILGRGHSYKSAEELIRRLENITDSEDAAQCSLGTRAHPGKKKQKFQSKTYQLAPPEVKSSERTQTHQIQSVPAETMEQMIQPTCSYRSSTVHQASTPTENNQSISGVFNTVLPMPTIPVHTGILNRPSVEAYPSVPGTSLAVPTSMIAPTNFGNVHVPGPGLQNTAERHLIEETADQSKAITIVETAAHEEQIRPIENEINVSDPLHIIEINGKQYIQLQNGIYTEISTVQSNITTSIDAGESGTPDQTKNDRQITLNDIDVRLTRIELCLQKLTLFMADVTKFMEGRTNPPTSIMAVKKKREGFEDVDALFPINLSKMLGSI